MGEYIEFYDDCFRMIMFESKMCICIRFFVIFVCGDEIIIIF